MSLASRSGGSSVTKATIAHSRAGPQLAADRLGAHHRAVGERGARRRRGPERGRDAGERGAEGDVVLGHSARAAMKLGPREIELKAQALGAPPVQLALGLGAGPIRAGREARA